MNGEVLIQKSPMAAIATSIRGGLQPGQVGGILGRAGVGKAAMLVHVALNALLRGVPVLHVSLVDDQARVRAFYDEILGALAREAGVEQTSALMLGVERHRVIHSALDRGAFGPAELSALLDTVASVMDFHPTVVVLHGIDANGLDVAAWRAVAAERGIRAWLAVRTHRDGGPRPETLVPGFDTAILLQPEGAAIALRLPRVAGRDGDDAVALHLDPVTMLVSTEAAGDPLTAPPSPSARSCTLFHGGARGAEAAFGETAERWGVREVTFTFDGHEAVRVRGERRLGDRELRAGDVSMLYVNRKLGRTWARDAALKRVLQQLWHVVGSAEQVFVVGTIRDDGTVHGGTGWSVELARKWHKPVWVYDQEARGWYRWDGERWTPGEPVIQSPRFAGTGTRDLADHGRRAIEELFARSFGDATA